MPVLRPRYVCLGESGAWAPLDAEIAEVPPITRRTSSSSRLEEVFHVKHGG